MPPYVPALKSDTDVSNFDEEVVNEGTNFTDGVEAVADKTTFNGFTYISK